MPVPAFDRLRPSARLVASLFSPPLSLALGYMAGLVATWSLGAGAGGEPLMNLAAPAVAGLAIRYRRALVGIDLALLAVARLLFMIATGEEASVAALGFAFDVAAIWCGCAVFSALRARRFISSQARLTAAVGAVALSLAAVVCGAGLADGSLADPTRFAAAFAGAALGATLILMVALSFDRSDRRFAYGLAGADDRPPSAREIAASVAALLAIAVVALADGRQEFALAASAALLWFAMRLGLFATALAAFLLTAAIEALGGGAGWTALAQAGPAEADLMRALALGLLTVPSLFVAAAVHDHRSARRDFAFRALHDGLTTLANRTLFLDALNAASTAARLQGRRFALLLIDLDHFKAVNDGYGHPRGDAMLVEVARRLRETVRATDLVARLGGDEFAIIAPVPTAEDAARLAARLVRAIDKACQVDGLELRPTITVGVAIAPDCSVDPIRLMSLADGALYEAKAAGRNCWRIRVAEPVDVAASDRWSEAGEPQARIVYLD